MNWNELLQQAIVYILGVVIIPAVLVWLVGYVRDLKTRTESDKRYSNLWYVHDGVKLLEELVIATQETVVRDVKAASADGKITAAEGAKIKADVIDTFLRTVTSEIKEAIRHAKGDIALWASRMVENILATVIKKKFPNS